jgi:hypothetical protein
MNQTGVLISQQHQRIRWGRWFWAGGVLLLSCGWDFAIDDGPRSLTGSPGIASGRGVYSGS